MCVCMCVFENMKNLSFAYYFCSQVYKYICSTASCCTVVEDRKLSLCEWICLYLI